LLSRDYTTLWPEKSNSLRKSADYRGFSEYFSIAYAELTSYDALIPGRRAAPLSAVSSPLTGSKNN
jgi:hypothetical protein